MLKLGVVSLLLIVQGQAQPSPGPDKKMHASADDFAQVYWVNNNFDPTAIGTPLYQVGFSHQIPVIPTGQGATFLAVAASNNGAWTKTNPAFIILSTDPRDPTTSRIVTDASWKCNKYDRGNFPANKWPASTSGLAAVSDAASKYENSELLPAVELSPTGFIPLADIQLGAKFIWYAGLGTDYKDDLQPPTSLPAENVVCLIKLKN